ncbi:hypothetical protein [Dyella acidisoli]|nr:hypothetical protein [Dyella acidisoli]
MADIDAHPTIVSIALIAKSAAEVAKKARSDVCEAIMGRLNGVAHEIDEAGAAFSTPSRDALIYSTHPA